MPAVKPLPPSAIKALLEAKGYELIGADDYNWAFARNADEEPVFVPISVALVPLEVAFHIAKKVGFNDYFEAIAANDQADQASPNAPSASS